MESSEAVNGKLTSPAVVKRILDRHGIILKHSLGQNLLVDENILKKILAYAELRPTDHVLEIGAGIGTLTAALAGHCETVVAIEVDGRMIPVLQENISPYSNVVIIKADAARQDFRALMRDHGSGKAWKVVSNLPYGITSPVILNLLRAGDPIQKMVLMVQKEVARRIAAPSGSKEYGFLSVACQFKARVRVVATVAPAAFMPPPEVDSAIVVLDVKEKTWTDAEEEMLFKVVGEAFRYRRKTIVNALARSWGREAAEAACREAGIDPGRRGETLSLEEFMRVSRGIGTKFANEPRRC